jgi:phosphatidate phosphatase APP1
MFGLISDFLLQSGFPCSELVLKHADLSDGSLSSFIKADQLAYKTGEIRRIMNRFPERKFILLGDSGEKDPEVYAGITAEYPGRVTAVCIRDLSAAGETKKRIDALKKKNERWILFKDGTDLDKPAV